MEGDVASAKELASSLEAAAVTVKSLDVKSSDAKEPAVTAAVNEPAVDEPAVNEPAVNGAVPSSSSEEDDYSFAALEEAGFQQVRVYVCM